jgi:LysM repeat protein
VQHVADQASETRTHMAAAHCRWLFALVMFAIGIVPVTAIANAVSAPACSGAPYTVVSGDSWSRIASRAHVSMTALMNANGATTATVIHPGQALCLPSAATPPATTPPPATTTPAPPAAPTGAPLVSIPFFPVQGPCSFADTYAAPRGSGRSHEGVDIIAKAGQWIYAVNDGTLTKRYLDAAGSLSGNGWRLTATDGTYYFYAHLSTFAPGLTVGSTVKAGQILGQVGMTGNAPIPHLHFEVHPGGGPSVNPTLVVKAVDGCRTTTVPPQPNGVPPGGPAPTAPAPTVPPVAAPAPTVPTAPTTTVPTYVPEQDHRRPADPTVPVGRPRR